MPKIQKAEQKAPVAKNYIYVNAERVRSLLSQKDTGELTTLESARGHETEGGVDAKASVPFLAEGSGHASRISRRQTTETRSVHHYLYQRFEELFDFRNLNDQFQDESWRSGTAQKSLNPGDLFR